MFKPKIYELENKPIDKGAFCQVHRIIGKKKLIAKINSEPEFPLDFKQELAIGKLLYKNKISTPRYIGICDVKYKNEVREAIILEVIEDCFLIKKQNISYNLTIVQKRAFELLNLELKKIEELPFKLKINDFQGLYSKSKDKIFIIDFGNYKLEN